MAVFAREILGREVVDSHSQLLGVLRDVSFDKQSGSITVIQVKIEANLDPNALPWELIGGLMQIPIEEVSRIASKVHLKR